MCEFRNKLDVYLGTLLQWTQFGNIPNMDFLQCILNSSPHKCPACGTPLSYADMFPQGRCSRSLCSHCYQKYFQFGYDPHCRVCGELLPPDKIQKIKDKPREVRNHLHEECMPLWTLLHCYVVGEPAYAAQIVEALRSRFTPQRQIPFQYDVHNQSPFVDTQDFIDVPYTQVTPLHLSGSQRAIPTQTGQIFNLNQIFEKQEKEKVTLISLPKKY